MIRECIILAGGLGTRLRSELPDLPKVLAPVREQPFLSYLLEWLERNGVTRIILSLGYHAEEVVRWCRTYKGNSELVFSIEEQPLGTGGAISRAMHQVKSEYVLVTNGDTFFDVNLNAMDQFHRKQKADITIALKPIWNADRYGTVVMDDGNRITGFKEKGAQENGLINGGLYMIHKESLQNQKDTVPYSFEKDFLEIYCSRFSIFGFISDTYFIDIGVPEDYRKAQTDLPGIDDLK